MRGSICDRRSTTAAMSPSIGAAACSGTKGAAISAVRAAAAAFQIKATSPSPCRPAIPKRRLFWSARLRPSGLSAVSTVSPMKPARTGETAMVRKTDRDSVIEHALGSLGLFLLGLIGWAVDRLEGRSPIDAVLARLVLGCVTLVGWVIDRLPSPDPHRRDRDDSTKERALPSTSVSAHRSFKTEIS